jgi:hypothetical protein
VICVTLRSAWTFVGARVLESGLDCARFGFFVKKLRNKFVDAPARCAATLYLAPARCFAGSMAPGSG